MEKLVFWYQPIVAKISIIVKNYETDLEAKNIFTIKLTKIAKNANATKSNS